MSNGRVFDKALKEQVARRLTKGGERACDLAREPDISDKIIGRWKAEYEAGIGWAQSNEDREREAAEAALRKENLRLRQEVEILKKASAYFARYVK